MPAKAQINVRLDPDDLDAIEAAVFVRRLRSAQDLLGPLVSSLADSLRADAAVADAIKLRASETSSVVTELKRAKR